jgi:hypothetical protein
MQSTREIRRCLKRYIARELYRQFTRTMKPLAVITACRSMSAEKWSSFRVGRCQYEYGPSQL